MFVLVDIPGWILYVVLGLLIAMSAFFSASETAFSSVNTMRLKSLVEDGDARAKKALDIAEHFDKTLATILVGNNVVNIAGTSLATVLATAISPKYGAIASTVIMTILVLIFGEILPKNFAKENSERLSLAVSGALSSIIVVLSPISAFFQKITSLTSKWSKKGQDQPYVTEDELKYIIETIEEEGVLDEQESDLVQSALDFDDITVQQILTPRVDLITVNVDDDAGHITQTVIAEKKSRIPVYEKTVDNILGILYVRDWLECLALGNQPDVRQLLHPCPFIHKTMKIMNLLNELKKNKVHMAVVTDDYGGTMGIVTMEDILEELVGDIWDESDEVKNEFIRIDDDHFEVRGDMAIDDMFDLFDIHYRDFESDYSSMGGWAIEMLEHIPHPGEYFTYKDIRVTVQEMEDQRIMQLLVERLPAPPPEET